ncbi:phage major capsid protein [Hymenobacter sp. HD11105]
MKKFKELTEDRAKKLGEARALTDAAETEKRELTEAEEQRFDALTKEVKELDVKIARAKEIEDVRAINAGSSSEAVRHGGSTQDQRDLNSYSFLRAINSKLNDRPLDGIEGEMHQEAERQYRAAGLNIQGNLLIPQSVLAGAGLGQRAMTATGQTTVAGDQGGMAIATNIGSFIERLRARLVMGQMGATMLDGLVGNVDFPKFIPNDNAAEKGENEDSNESSPTIGKVSLSPRRLPVFTEVSRQLLVQTSASVEAMLRDDLAFQIASVMDLSAIRAILNEAGIGSVVGGANGAAPTWENIVALETAVAAANADYGTLGYLTNPKVRGKLKTTQKFEGSNGQPVWEAGESPLNGYRAAVSTQVPSNLTKGTANAVASALIYGNFRDLLMGQWGGIEFLVNPYAKDKAGLIRINAWTFFDEAIRNAQSFAAMKDALVA